MLTTVHEVGNKHWVEQLQWRTRLISTNCAHVRDFLANERQGVFLFPGLSIIDVISWEGLIWWASYDLCTYAVCQTDMVMCTFLDDRHCRIKRLHNLVQDGRILEEFSSPDRVGACFGAHWRGWRRELCSERRKIVAEFGESVHFSVGGTSTWNKAMSGGNVTKKILESLSTLSKIQQHLSERLKLRWSGERATIVD